MELLKSLSDPVGVATTIICTGIGIFVTYRLTKRKYKKSDTEVSKAKERELNVIQMKKDSLLYIGDFKKDVCIYKKKDEGSD